MAKSNTQDTYVLTVFSRGTGAYVPCVVNVPCVVTKQHRTSCKHVQCTLTLASQGAAGTAAYAWQMQLAYR